MNPIHDPLLPSGANEWPPPPPPAQSTPPVQKGTNVRAQRKSPADRRQMLEDLKAQKAAQAQPVAPEVAPTSRTNKKKSARPARAAKVLVFGLSTTAMFGAVTGYALAEMQKQQQNIPAVPVATETIVPTAQIPTPAPVNDPVAATSQSDANTAPVASNTPKKKKTQTTQPAQAPASVAPVVEQPAAALADATNTNVVVDVPVPSAAQPGQGQTSGGKQKSSGSH